MDQEDREFTLRKKTSYVIGARGERGKEGKTKQKKDN